MSVSADFKIKAEQIANDNEDYAAGTAWLVTITNPRGKTFTRKYFMGSAHNGTTPTVDGVMSCHAMDASAGNSANDAEEFAYEFGYDYETPEDRRKVKRIYNSCTVTAKRLAQYLTEEEFEYFAGL